jgi:hypothetical protein
MVEGLHTSIRCLVLSLGLLVSRVQLGIAGSTIEELLECLWRSRCWQFASFSILTGFTVSSPSSSSSSSCIWSPSCLTSPSRLTRPPCLSCPSSLTRPPCLSCSTCLSCSPCLSCPSFLSCSRCRSSLRRSASSCRNYNRAVPLSRGGRRLIAIATTEGTRGVRWLAAEGIRGVRRLAAEGI